MVGILAPDKKRITQEEEDLIWSWNAQPPPTRSLTIAQVFAAQVKESPSALAVDAADGTLTYAQLDTYSTRLALYLRSIRSDVRSDEVVPICWDKSTWSIVCMIAVAKAGMAFTTLDPSHPAERLRVCLAVVDARVLLVEERFAEKFSGMGLTLVSELTKVCGGVSGDDAGKDNGAADLPVGQPTDLAFIVFTSGSTGTPKASQHTHSGAVSSIKIDVNSGHQYPRENRYLNLASQAYAVNTHFILKTICNGGLLVLPPEKERMGDISSFITRKGITETFFTPTYLNLLRPDDVKCLKKVSVGGERVTQQLISTWAPRLLLNEWCGMSEGVIISAVFDASGKRTRASQLMTGCAWIVDADDPDRLAPIGETGELYFEGPGVMQAYRNNPETTTTAIVEEVPAWAEKRSKRPMRLLRTGDLAKYVDDGVVQYVGRKDSRVKLYGQRFGLGEVEAAILDLLPQGAVVVAEVVEPASGNGPMLIAFIHGLSGNFSLEARQLRERLKSKVPDYMIPRGLIELMDYPTNNSGKLDRKVLRQRAAEMPLIELVKHMVSLDKSIPATQEEKTMQSLWATVLGIPAEYIGLEDEFFYIGGDSLQSIKLIAEARKQHISISIDDILEHGTLKAMSAVARFAAHELPPKLESEDSTYTTSSAILNFARQDIEEIALATDYQAWCVGQGLFKSHGWQDYFIFKYKDSMDTKKLQNACQQLVHRHGTLRTVFIVKERKTLQVVVKPEAYPFRFIVKELGDGVNMDEYVNKTIRQDTKRRTQLGDALVAFTLFKNVTDNTQHLVIRISHAQYDAHSMNKLWRSLEALYYERPLEVIPFTKFCAESSVASKTSELFWKQALANTCMSELRHHARPSVSFLIDSAIKASVPLVDLRAASGFTTATVVFAAWSIVLSQLTGRNDVLFGYINSGRHLPMPRISEVMGPCMTFLPLHTDISPTGPTSSLLTSIQRNYLKALPYSNLGHSRIIEKCTSWPRWTRFSTVVNHLSFTRFDPPFLEHLVGDPSIYYEGDSRTYYEPAHDKADLWLQTLPYGNTLEIQLRYSAEAFSKEWVSTVLEYFTAVYAQLPNVLECPLSESFPKSSLVMPRDVPADRLQQITVDSSLETDYPRALEEMVLSSWESVLGADFKEHPGFSHDTPFYEIWGNGAAAGGLAFEYSRRGYEVSCEEVLDAPSIREAVAYLAARMKSESD